MDREKMKKDLGGAVLGEDRHREKIVQTTGRNALGEFAPEFAHFNDDVLFGENWNNEDIDLKTRSIITVVFLQTRHRTALFWVYREKSDPQVLFNAIFQEYMWRMGLYRKISGIDT